MVHSPHLPGDPALERALRAALEGEVRFDRFTRGIYATDASHYQIEPIGVVFPKHVKDVSAVFDVARTHGVPVLPRGGGTSQCGQTIGRAIVLDTNRHLTGIGEIEWTPDDPRHPAEIEVEPGVVLDDLNAHLRPHGLWFPVDPSTSSRATIGGMAGNNSAGARSIQYGMMVDNVSALDALLADGRHVRIGKGGNESEQISSELTALRALYAREAAEIERVRPRTMRNVAGYDLDRLAPDQNLSGLFIGSEGTLSFFSRLRLKLSALPTKRVLGVCHFPSLVTALDAVQHLVILGPSAVELVDGHVLALASEHPDFAHAMKSFVRGSPGSLLLVEFAGQDGDLDLPERLDALEERLTAIGFPDSLVRAESAREQAAVWSVRKAGLNIVMSMAGPRKPISFIEDCAVPLEHLAEYAVAIDEIFSRHGTSGTWYAHASVGCLHVRPALNLRDPDDVRLVRTIAEETHEVVRRFGGTHSGEHGDGILRSEFLETMLGRRMTSAFAEVKQTLDPDGMMNPGRIVDPPRMDDRSLFRLGPDYPTPAEANRQLPVVLAWEDGGVLSTVESCNNNGACRKRDPGVMCPSFRATRDERHSTRGRANALRLALTGQLGEGGLDSAEMADAMSLCISCKGCRRECPAGVDMARVKLEWQHRQNQRKGVSLLDRALASLPRIAPVASRVAPLANFLGRNPVRGRFGLSTNREIPRWSRSPWRDGEVDPDGARASGDRTESTADVVLFVDTFTRWFESEHARAANAVLRAGPWTAGVLSPPGGERPLCCGRTYLSLGMLDEARHEAERLLNAARPWIEAGVPIVGLEPSCLYTLVDEMPALLPGREAEALAASSMMLEGFLAREAAEGRRVPYSDTNQERVLVHGHCHDKAFGGFGTTVDYLRSVPGLDVEIVAGGCCGMAGSFGYKSEHYETSMAMGELDVFPAVRAAEEDVTVVTDGTSCRAQIADGTSRHAEHVATLLARRLP